MTDQPQSPESTATDELRSLLTKAEQGDLSVLPALRQILDDRSEIWQEYGNLALQAECALIKLAAGNNLLLAESIVRKQAAFKVELAGSSSSPLERSLAERVAICWLQVSYWDGLLANSKGVLPEKLEPIRKHHDSAHRRYLSAAKMLATVRKLLQPALSPLQIATTQSKVERSGLPERIKAASRFVPVAN